MYGLYIHIPFCKSRCIYCSFYSTTLADKFQDTYVDALIGEMRMRKRADVATIYIGGGTPSQLSVNNLQRLFHIIYNYYNVSDDAEVTIECNPDDITPQYAHALSLLPVNRVSLGAQTFDNQRLRFLHRRHTAEQVYSAVSMLRNAGIKNISLDLMFGFPKETLADCERDINALLTIMPEHISAYSLMYEEGTVLTRMREVARIQTANKEEDADEEELSREMYEMIMDKLGAAGYNHYEISNWCGRRSDGQTLHSRHNSSYWAGIPYIGIGASAHSYDVKTRSWNVSDIRTYIDSIGKGIRPHDFETLDNTMRYNDLITTALRTSKGISTTSVEQYYRDYLLKNAERHIASGMMTLHEGRLSLTRQGLFVSDDIMSDLIFV